MYSFLFNVSYKKNSEGVRLGERVGHNTGPLYSIQLFRCDAPNGMIAVLTLVIEAESDRAVKYCEFRKI